MMISIFPDFFDPTADPEILNLKIRDGQVNAGLSQMIAQEMVNDDELKRRFLDTSRITVNGREVPVPPGLMAEAAAIANKDSLDWFQTGDEPPSWCNPGGRGGQVEFQFSDITSLLSFIWGQLHTHSPIGIEANDHHPGLYLESHVLLMDGDETDASIFDQTINIGGSNMRAESGSTFVFYNKLPYAGKIEEGESPQFPDGLYHAVAGMAQQMTSAPGMFNPTGLATISFAWDGPDGAPAITVKRPTFS